MKYKVAKDDEFPTSMTLSAFRTITWSLSKGEQELLPRTDVLKEYGKIVSALLGGRSIIFTADEELPF